MIRVAVVGAGQWGPNLIRNFHNRQTSEVVCVIDRDAARLALVRARFPDVQVGPDAEPVLVDPDVDAVVAATPTSTHHRLVKTALEHGKHVLVEKPITSDVDQAEELRSLAERAGRILMVGHVFLYNAGVRRVKQLLDAGKLGRVYYVSMVRTNLGPIRTDVNAAWDLASHDISIVNYWLGAEPKSASALGGSWINEGIEDVVFATLRYPGEVLVNLHVSWLNPRKARDITVVGEKRMLTFDDMNLSESLHIYDKRVTDERTPMTYVDSFASFRASVREGDITIPKVALGEPLRAECDHFPRLHRLGACTADGWRGGARGRARPGGDPALRASRRTRGEGVVPDAIPLVDLKAQHAEIADEVERGFARVCAQASFVLGPEVAAFEAAFARFSGVAHCVGVANGTDALELALRAVGVGAGDEVIMPANTFIATALAIARAGATPVLVDCDPVYHLIDAAAVPARLGPRTRAIVPVHLYGQMAPLEQLETAARAAGVLLIEDAAQAQGAMRHGIGAGGFGVAAGTSFYPGKNLGAYGDAGAVLTGSAELAAKVRALGNYGSEVKYEANARAVPGDRPLGTIACPEHRGAHRSGGFAYYTAGDERPLSRVVQSYGSRRADPHLPDHANHAPSWLAARWRIQCQIFSARQGPVRTRLQRCKRQTAQADDSGQKHHHRLAQCALGLRR